MIRYGDCYKRGIPDLWGFLAASQSHLQVREVALAELRAGRPTLVMEDDCELGANVTPRVFRETLAEIFDKLPREWRTVQLGGCKCGVAKTKRRTIARLQHGSLAWGIFIIAPKSRSEWHCF